MENADRKIPFILKLLTLQLIKEKRELEFWKKNENSTDEKTVVQAKGNISSCESRVQQLEEALTDLRK